MMKQLQKLGRSLMQPVAVLPVAAILMGIGYYIDPAGWGGGSPAAAFFIKAGAAVLDNLGLLFAVGVAYGMSKDKDGAAALSGLVGFLVITTLLSPGAVAQLRGVPVEEVLATEGFAKVNNGNAFIGILTGCVAAFAYNKFYQVKLPDALAFFSGRRLTPIMTVFFMLITTGIMYFVWPIVYSLLVVFGTSISGLGALGAGIYAFFNRLLIPTGLHHALNAVFWWDTIGINDIPNFLNAQPATFAGVTTGMYQAGFFPVMMFGLPGAALAMYTTAKNDKRKVAASLLLAGSVSAFLTGVTEPIEFAFMFLAPGLYLVHALLTGLSVFISAAMGWMAGFGFSAGLIDYLLSLKNPVATNVWMLIPQGILFFGLYFAIFRFAIVKFDLKTPGREEDIDENEGTVFEQNADFSTMAKVILDGLGGKDNIESLEYCITRLRVNVKEYTQVDEAKIKKAQVAGVIRPSRTNVQIVVGPQVQFVYEEVKKLM
ncbi:MAG: N-acetylglucosamine-specific PTS transporter subunit IIBC [Peptostreptococcaceae bacterium]|nr:N-acetylglucosamine-specific PTS transporter subunit IIBC [Peptostreptococcaceae bacterium]